MKTAAPFVALESVVLNKEINSIAKVGAKLNARVQAAALSCIYYVNEHGDTGYANRLMAAFNGGMRKSALQTFLTKYGKLEYSQEKKSLIFNKAAVVLESIDDIKENWYDCKPVKVQAESIDLEAEVVAFIKRMEKRLTETPQVLNASCLDLVKLALDQFREEQVAEETDQAVTQEIKHYMAAINQPARMAA